MTNSFSLRSKIHDIYTIKFIANAGMILFECVVLDPIKSLINTKPK